MVFSVKPSSPAPSAKSYMYTLNTSISGLVSVPLVIHLFLRRVLLHFFLQRDHQEMKSPGFKNIKMLLVQVLHFRKVKPQHFRLLNFPVSHHVRHLESGYLICKGKMLGQLVTCGRMRRDETR